MTKNRQNASHPTRLFKRVALALSLSLFASCVTVNVNFPESAVQKATDDYVKDLYRAKEKGKTPAPSPTPTEKGELKIHLITAAFADTTVRVDSAKASDIKTRMAGRVDDIIAQKRAGILGETNDGKLALHKADKSKKLLMTKLEKLVKDENKDREELYEDVQKTNGLQKSNLKDIEKSFARSFQSESPSGTWIQDADGSWTQKP